MTQLRMSIALAAILACAGCAGREAVTPADATPSGAARSTPQPAPSKPSSQEQPVTGSGSEGGAKAASTPAPASAVPAPAAAAGRGNAGQAPPATASAHVYSPQQAVSATPSPSALPQGAPIPAPSNSDDNPGTKPAPPDDASPQPGGELQLRVVASATEVAPGAVVTVDIIASSSTAVVDAPLHLTADPNVLEFVDGAPGDFLTQGGSSVVFLADGRSRPGDVAIAAGRVVREQGASGSGLLCRVRYRGVGVGASPVAVGQAKAWGTAGEELTVRSVGTNVVVR